jgi:hypothetical protein
MESGCFEYWGASHSSREELARKELSPNVETVHVQDHGELGFVLPSALRSFCSLRISQMLHTLGRIHLFREAGLGTQSAGPWS